MDKDFERLRTAFELAEGAFNSALEREGYCWRQHVAATLRESRAFARLTGGSTAKLRAWQWSAVRAGQAVGIFVTRAELRRAGVVFS